MNALISGYSGFVGKSLVPYILAQDHKCDSLSLRGDWSALSMDRYDAFIHLAGKAHDTENASKPEEYFRVNADYTKLLFDKFVGSTCRDFIYFSSVKAVADTVDGVLTEENEANPKTPYGQSKLQAEQYMLNIRLPEGKRLFILRPCMIHGPGNKGNLNLLYKVVNKGMPYPLGAFENRRSFLSIENLLDSVHRILSDHRISGGVYNLADDEALSTNELIHVIGKASGRKVRIWNVPRGIIKAMAKLGDVLHLPLNSERLKKLTENYVVDNNKLKQALGLQSMPISAKDGLTYTIKSFK